MKEHSTMSRYQRLPVLGVILIATLFGCYLFGSLFLASSIMEEKNVNWGEIFSYVPKTGKDCRQFFKNKTNLPFDFQQMKTVHRFQRAIGRHSNHAALEGHSGKYPEKQRAYWEMAKQPFVKVICEIGFNAGHSALVWLSANPEARLISFDLGEHTYTRQMADFIRREFPNRFEIHLGDSRLTVPDFYKNKGNPKCDICVVDGGHTFDIAFKDLNNMRHLANLEHNILILDDYPTWWAKHDLGKPWHDAIAAGDIKEFYNCEYKGAMGGYSVGTYLNPDRI